MAQVLFYVILFLLNNVWNKLYEIIQCDQWIGEIEEYFMIDIKKKKETKNRSFFLSTFILFGRVHCVNVPSNYFNLFCWSRIFKNAIFKTNSSK